MAVLHYPPRTRERPPSGSGRLYPSFEPGVQQSVIGALRKLFDFLYEMRDLNSPRVILAERPVEDIVVDNEPRTGLATLVTTRSGFWLFSANLELAIFGDGGQFFELRLLVGGVEQATKMTVRVAEGQHIAVSQQWLVECDFEQSAVLWISKLAGAGASYVVALNLTFAASWGGR
jgi:hypothetical protein